MNDHSIIWCTGNNWVQPCYTIANNHRNNQQALSKQLIKHQVFYLAQKAINLLGYWALNGINTTSCHFGRGRFCSRLFSFFQLLLLLLFLQHPVCFLLLLHEYRMEGIELGHFSSRVCFMFLILLRTFPRQKLPLVRTQVFQILHWKFCDPTWLSQSFLSIYIH